MDRDKIAHFQSLKATLGFVLTCAYEEKFERRIRIESSFSDGWYARDEKVDEVKQEDIDALQVLMRSMVDKYKIEETTLPRSEVLSRLKTQKREDKIPLFRIYRADPVPVIVMEKYWDTRLRPMETDRSLLIDSFVLMKYQKGILLRFIKVVPGEGPVVVPDFKDSPRFFTMLEDHQRWGDVLGVRNVSELNNRVYTGEVKELMLVAEGLHEKKIAEVAAKIVEEYPKKAVICLAGPSASGKTTMAKRIGVQLRVHGLKSLLISMDDYYNDPEDVPLFPDGTPDYDCVESVNISLLADRVKRLINGEEVPIRKFDFFTHRGKDLAKTMKLPDNCAVLMEGIHGLNPKLSDSFGGKDAVHTIYVSALTHLNIDDSHHISTSDNRLLRRILRDYRTRGYSATETLQMWGIVRAAEEKHIFPFQEYADFVLNTALVYELPVLANYVKPLLAEVSGDAAAEEEAERLLRFLNLFYPMTDEYVPKNSLLREFCGGSTFSY